MNRVNVTSGNIKSIGYDASTRVLEVEFKPYKNADPNSAGRVYPYANVPPHEHANLMAADSIGSYFAANIKGRFEIVPQVVK